MNFCPDCQTYLITKISNSDNANKILTFVCNNCSYSKSVDITKEPEYKCVYQHNFNIKKIKVDQKNIKYLSKDPTLPHVNNIPCPNRQCSTNKDNSNSEVLGTDTQNINDVLYIKLNESDLTFMYQCCNCQHTWTNK
jgi:DNA-directed RNA polymerase subunit M/transcription elongation factor TFIIS